MGGNTQKPGFVRSAHQTSSTALPIIGLNGYQYLRKEYQMATDGRYSDGKLRYNTIGEKAAKTLKSFTAVRVRTSTAVPDGVRVSIWNDTVLRKVDGSRVATSDHIPSRYIRNRDGRCDRCGGTEWPPGSRRETETESLFGGSVLRTAGCGPHLGQETQQIIQRFPAPLAPLLRGGQD